MDCAGRNVASYVSTKHWEIGREPPRRPSPDPSPLSGAEGRALQFCHLLGCHVHKGVAVPRRFHLQFSDYLAGSAPCEGSTPLDPQGRQEHNWDLSFRIVPRDELRIGETRSLKRLAELCSSKKKIPFTRSLAALIQLRLQLLEVMMHRPQFGPTGKALLISLLALCSCAAMSAQISPLQSGMPGGRRVFARVDGPTVPVSPGSWSQAGELIGSTNQALFTINYFGTSVGISGNTIVVSNGWTEFSSGAAAVFVKPATGWRNMLPQATLSFPVGVTDTSAEAAIDGDTVVVSGGTAAYVYVKPASGWTDMSPTATLTTTDGVSGIVAISGDTIVLGNAAANSDFGAAYVFVKPSGGWTDMTQTAKLTASQSEQYTDFGRSISISGNTIAVGGPGPFQTTDGRGYVFVEPSTGWVDMTETAQLKVAGLPKGSSIGSGISIYNDTILVGSSAGEAFVFVKPASGWTNNLTPAATLVPVDGTSSGFSSVVALGEDIAAVGAVSRGRVYIFREPSGGWKNLSSNTVLTGSNAHYYCEFGAALAVQGNVVVAGAPFAMNWTGASYVFQLP
jgi:hypothetical protein